MKTKTASKTKAPKAKKSAEPKLKSESKYDLRDLHAEIDLYDRKIIHAENYESFESDADRAAAVAKLASKRETLVKNAMAMADSGVEYDSKTLPRSFKAQAQAEAAQAEAGKSGAARGEAVKPEPVKAEAETAPTEAAEEEEAPEETNTEENA